MRVTDAEARRYLAGMTFLPVAMPAIRDNRTQVPDTTLIPWAAIGQVLATFPSGMTLVSSGTLIDDQFIVTAGHALYDAAYGGQATGVTFTPGLSDTIVPYGVFEVPPANMFFLPGFQPGTANDYGMLNLAQNLGGTIGGNYTLMNLSDDQLNDLGGFQITGYPIDKGGDAMWTAAGLLSAFNDDFVFTESAFANAGESGGPAWALFEDTDEFGLFGIFIGSNAAGMTSIRMTDTVVAQYMVWMNG